MSDLRKEEVFALQVVSRVLGVEVEAYDLKGRQSAVDGLIHFSDGRTAALEISSIGAEDEAIAGYLNNRGHRRAVDGLMCLWYVQVPPNFHPADLRLLDRVLLDLERESRKTFDYRAIWDEAVNERLMGVFGSVIASGEDALHRRKPGAFIFTRSLGGFLHDGIQPLPDELARQLQTPTVQAKIRKLMATGLAERHLFLHVRPSAFSFPVYDGLAFGIDLPLLPPQLPPELSQVWLLSGWQAGGVVRAIGPNEWRRDQPYDQAS
ncbi:hypothetical protein GT755_22825 [Herbidospora sp. NEAU-GS84]|uniref:Uncharacterized protein n=1 Tax=Herbidospora solisilvae TaxID=2696284 RepID=A0A7C9MZ12_9ACTN|nr:hypothetical protein [Herbidospora solisilvae]NAS24511.1 hypothetical protein [Herbidospora solisilvae]